MDAYASSSSELEVVAHTKTPSPVKPRRSARDRRAPRSKDDLAAPAAARVQARGQSRTATPTGAAGSAGRQSAGSDVTLRELNERDGDGDGGEIIGGSDRDRAAKQRERSRHASTSKVTLDDERLASRPSVAPPESQPPGYDVKPEQARIGSQEKRLSLAPGQASARASTSRSPQPPTASTSVPPAQPAPRPKPPRVPRARHSSSDEADDFFARAKKPKKQPLRMPGRAAGPPASRRAPAKSSAPRVSSPSAKVQSVAVGSSSEDEFDKAQRRTSPARIPPADDGDSSSTTFSSPVKGVAASDSDDSDVSDPENIFSSSSVRPKGLNLPAWARGGIARLSGADLERMQRGPGKNRKRRRLDDESDDEGSSVAGKKAGAAAGKRTGLSAFDGMGGDLWNKQLEATAAANAAAAAAAAANAASAAAPGGSKGKRAKDANLADDSDDSIEAEFAIYEKPEPHVALAPPPGSPSKQRRTASAGARSATLSASPSRPFTRASREPSIVGQRSPTRRSASVADPEAPKPKRTAAFVVSSGDEDEATVAARREREDAAFAADTDSEDEGDEGYMNRLRSMVARSTSATGARSPSVPASGASAVSAPAKDLGPTITIRLRMVFDPSRTVPEIAKKAYEREEVFSLCYAESFSSLFYELSIRRTLAREQLVITHCKATTGSDPLPPSRQTQVYEFGTPASLRLEPTTQVIEMRGYTRDVWQKCKEHERLQRLQAVEEEDEEAELAAAAEAAAAARRSAGLRATPSGPIDLGDGSSSDVEAPPAAAAAAAAELTSKPAAATGAEDLDGLFPLTMRGSKTRTVSLAVKPATTMAQLVRAYCEQFKIAKPEGVAIEFEGERLESTRTVADVQEEYDLEGEETFDIKERP